MLSHALSASFANPSEHRVSDRRVLRLEARLAMPAGEGGIEVHNLSRTGMLVESTAAVPAGTVLEVELPSGTSHRAKVVWADEGLFGCRFERPLSRASLSAALLRAAPQTLETPEAVLVQESSMAKLREHWSFEHEIQSRSSAGCLSDASVDHWRARARGLGCTSRRRLDLLVSR